MYWIGRERLSVIKLVEDLQKDVTDLQRYRKVRQTVLSRQPRTQRTVPAASDPTKLLARIQAIREVSKRLYDSLEEMTTCPCHSINLQLDVIRDAPDSATSESITKFRLVLNKGDQSACGNCDCMSIVIATETTSKAGTSSTSGGPITSTTTSITVNKPSGSATTRVKKRVRWGDESDDADAPEPPVKRACREDEQDQADTSEPIPVTLKRRGSGFEITMPGGKRFRIDDQSLSDLRGNTNGEMTLAAMEDPAVPCSTKIDELCCLLKKFGANQIPEVDRFLLGKRRSSGLENEYNIYREQLEKFRSMRHSLATLITTQDRKRRLSLSERLQICLTLSISLLYFGSYPKSRSFFQKQWRSGDIFFFDHSDPHTRAKPLDRFIPHVVPRFEKPSTRTSCVDNELLFSLGVVMIETAMGCPLFEVDPDLNIGEPGNPLAEFTTACNIENDVLMDEIGATYSSVVEICVKCKFDGSLKPYDLMQEKMQVCWMLGGDGEV